APAAVARAPRALRAATRPWLARAEPHPQRRAVSTCVRAGARRDHRRGSLDDRADALRHLGRAPRDHAVRSTARLALQRGTLSTARARARRRERGLAVPPWHDRAGRRESGAVPARAGSTA